MTFYFLFSVGCKTMGRYYGNLEKWFPLLSPKNDLCVSCVCKVQYFVKTLIIIIIIIIVIIIIITIKVSKASSLTLKIIWSKRVSFFIFLRCRILMRRSHGSRLSAIVRSDSICCYWTEWMKVDPFF